METEAILMVFLSLLYQFVTQPEPFLRDPASLINHWRTLLLALSRKSIRTGAQAMLRSTPLIILARFDRGASREARRQTAGESTA